MRRWLARDWDRRRLEGSYSGVAESTRARSNREWQEELRAEDREALADLWRYLLAACVTYLNRRREDLPQLDRQDLEQLAEDFTQEALLQVIESLDTFRGDSKFTTWAYRFVINIAAAELRLRRWRTVSMEVLTGEYQAPLFTFVSDDKAPDPETVAARNEILVLLHQIIDEELTDLQRVALVSVHFQGLPVVVVARELESTPNNVYKLLHDARKKLKKGLQRHQYSQADVLAIFGER